MLNLCFHIENNCSTVTFLKLQMEVFESEPQDTSLGFSIPEGYTLTCIYIFLANFIT